MANRNEGGGVAPHTPTATRGSSPQGVRKQKIMYETGRKAFSYNKAITILLGGRGLGKTYLTTSFVFKKFLYQGKKFIWIRDSDDAVRELTENNGHKFAQTVLNKFNDFEFTIKDGKNFYINGKHAGYLMSLNTYYKRKGNEYSDADIVVIDELIAEADQKSYGDKARKFVNTLENIIRMRKGVRVIMLSNAIDRGDPILNLLGIHLKGYGIYLNNEKETVCHYLEPSKEFIEAKKNSLMGKILKGTQYEDNIIVGSFTDDEELYFKKLPSKAYLMGCLHNRNDESIRAYIGDNYMFIKNDVNRNMGKNRRYVFNYLQVNTERMLVPDSIKRAIENSIKFNRIKYDNANSKRILLEFISGK